MNSKLKEGDLVEVHGFVMLAKIEPGRYRIKRVGLTSNGIPYYDFCRPRGHKTIVRHAINSVDPFLRQADDPDLNKMVKVS